LSFEAESHLNSTYEFSPYLKENTTLRHTTINLLTLLKEIIPVHAYETRKYEASLTGKADGAYSYRSAWGGLNLLISLLPVSIQNFL
jgi:hypothetical protein